jgi:ectoine hydroxylase-related dioxygenase (phytanoyl-CoA dioxygenase family)
MDNRQIRADWLAGMGSIGTALAELRQNGVAVVRNLVGRDRIEALLEESMRLWDAQAAPDPNNLRFGVRRDVAGGVTLERIDPVIDISAPFRRLNEDPRLLAIAEAHLGEPAIVMKEKLIYKWPGTSGYGAHRDDPYTAISGVPGAEVLTINLALDPVTEDTGPTEFFPSLRLHNTRAPRGAGDPRDVAEEALLGAPSAMPQLDPGDVVLFDALIPHRSAMNRSDHPRRTYMINFVPSRYPRARANYYAGRLREQAAERAPVTGGEFHFT